MTVQSLDIETVASAKALEMEAPEHWLTKGIASNWGEQAVEKHRAKRTAEWPEEILKRASLDWRLGQIVCISVCIDGDAMTHTTANVSEKELLQYFWNVIDRHLRTTGFNIRNFDLPWILGRSAVNRNQLTRRFRTNRYDPRDVIDWSDILSNYGAFDLRGWGLWNYVKWFGIDIEPVGKGGDVAAWVAEGDWDSVARHCEADAVACWKLDVMMAPAFLG